MPILKGAWNDYGLWIKRSGNPPHKLQAFCASTVLFFLGWMVEALDVNVIIWHERGPAWLSLPASTFFIPCSLGG